MPTIDIVDIGVMPIISLKSKLPSVSQVMEAGNPAIIWDLVQVNAKHFKLLILLSVVSDHCFSGKVF